MRIAIASDFHLGYAWGSERESDSFECAEEVLKAVVEGGADIILLAGDIFDSRVPRQEVVGRSLRLFSIPLHAKCTGVRAVGGKDVPTPALAGVPVVAIHGTHERRGTSLANPVHTLEAAERLVHLHCSTVVLEKNGERVAVHGMSGVPESYALDVLREWAPKPVEGCFNILMLHQSFKEYIYEKAAFLTIGDLPRGFDLVVNGHVHWNNIMERDGVRLLHPGSTIITQMRKVEAEQPKGYYWLETRDNGLEFRELASQRRLLYLELDFDKADAKEVAAKARAALDGALSGEFGRKPLVKLKLRGSLGVGASVDTAQISSGLGEKAIISVDNELISPDFKSRINLLRELQRSKRSVDEMGMDILKRNLDDAKYKGIAPDKLLQLLADGKTEEAIEAIYLDRADS